MVAFSTGNSSELFEKIEFLANFDYVFFNFGTFSQFFLEFCRFWPSKKKFDKDSCTGWVFFRPVGQLYTIISAPGKLSLFSIFSDFLRDFSSVVGVPDVVEVVQHLLAFTRQKHSSGRNIDQVEMFIRKKHSSGRNIHHEETFIDFLNNLQVESWTQTIRRQVTCLID